MKKASPVISPTKDAKPASGKSCSWGTRVVVAPVVEPFTISEWLNQPPRLFELEQATEQGVTVLEFRQRFLQIVTAWMREAPINDYIN